jgi:transposase-like protein
MAQRKHPKPINIRDIHIKFASEEHCLQYVEQMKWPDGVVRCPTCGDRNIKKYERPQTEPKRRKLESELARPGKVNRRHWFYICLNADCRQQFSPTSGTLFADSHLPLIVWFHAIGLILNAKKGISAKQIQRDLGLGSYKTAWYLNHRIRESMQDQIPAPLGGIVEVDETYVGGHIRGKGQKVASQKKLVVMGAVQRGGQIRFQHVPGANIGTFRDFITANIGDDVERVMTDQHRAYPGALAPKFTDRHETVNHIIGEYVRGDVYTNSIESAFSLLKRGVIGQFHKLSGKHLHRYLREFEYRFNRRHDDDVFIQTVRRLCGVKPLRFADLTANPVEEPF